MLRRAADPHRRGDPARGVRATRDAASRAGLAPRPLPGLGARYPGACRPRAGRSSTPWSRSRGRTPGGLFGLPEGEGFDVEYVSGQGLAGLPRVRRRSARPGQRQRRPARGRRSSCCTPSCTRRTPATTPRAASRRWPWSADAGCWSRPSWSCRRRSRSSAEGLAELGPSLLLDGEHRADVRSGRPRRRGRHRPRARPDRRGRRRAGAADPGRCRPAAARRRLVRGRGARPPPAVGTRRRRPCSSTSSASSPIPRTGATSSATRRASCAAGST